MVFSVSERRRPERSRRVPLCWNNSLMLDLQKYSCLGGALRHAFDPFPGETCLIEADRDREKTRLAYSDFKEISLPLARALEDAEFDAGDRAAVLMTNQSKWLISAYAIFYGGGVLGPLDYKLTAAEQLQLLEHSKAKVLVVEYYLWRAIMQSPEFQSIKTKMVLVTEAPLGAELAGAFRWEDFKRKGAPDFVMRQRQDVAGIVDSLGRLCAELAWCICGRCARNLCGTRLYATGLLMWHLCR